ncbi:hypothetical protein LINPERPRIM_LOCUS14423, partial [Linum perenne]
QFLFQVLVASARLEKQLTVEFEKVICWNHEVKIGDLLGVDLILYLLYFS